MNSDTEKERAEVWRLFVDAVKPLENPQVRIALALSVLSELMDSPRVPTAPILDAIGNAEAETYLRMYPPSGCAS